MRRLHDAPITRMTVASAVAIAVVATLAYSLSLVSCAQDAREGAIQERIDAFHVTLQKATVGGSATIAPEADSYAKGSVVVLSASPSEGYTFSGWSGDVVSTENPLSITVSADVSIAPVFAEVVPEREWTIAVYMSADNDLEEAAIEDLNELEAVDWSGRTVTVIALVDRAEGFDSSNGDWKDSRMYLIKTDPAGDNQTIVSERLACAALGITDDGATELNMSNPLTLSRFIDSAKAAYPARNYGLVVWGHGTGWRNGSFPAPAVMPAARAVALDDESRAYMTVRDLGSALGGKGLSFIGFDTCFSAALELVYEVRGAADYLVGSPGIEPKGGWSYANVFGKFLKTDKSGYGFCESAVKSFSEQYDGVPGSSISIVDLRRAHNAFERFETFAGALASGIANPAMRATALHKMFTDVRLFGAIGYPADCFVDIADFARAFGSAAGDYANSADIRSRADELVAELGAAVPATWASGGSIGRVGAGNGGMCVNLIPLAAANTPLFPHDSAYVRGSGDPSQSSFVRDSEHWVPNSVPSPSSFLDKLFYFVF